MTREEAISRINNDLECHKKELSAPYKTALKMAIEALQERKTGKWIYKCSDRICSVCNASFDDEIVYMCEDGLLKYCPNCGSRNEVSEE